MGKAGRRARGPVALVVLLVATLGLGAALVLRIRAERGPQPEIGQPLSARSPVERGSEALAGAQGDAGRLTAGDVSAGIEEPAGAAQPSMSPIASASPVPAATESAPRERGLRGRVLFADGSPAVGAGVCFSYSETATNADGRFLFSLHGSDLESLGVGRTTDPLFRLPIRADAPIVASLPDCAPALLPDVGALLLASFPNDPPELTLTLPEESWGIAGFLQDQNGRALRGWSVEVRDPSFPESQERIPCVTSVKGASSTSSIGFFSIEGLSAGSYSVRAYDPRTLASVERQGIAAGTQDLVLRARTDELHSVLRGRIVSRGGVPISGVQVMVLPGGSGGLVVRSATTDASGAFQLENVPRQGVQLVVDEAGISRASLAIEGIDPLAIEIVVTRLCHFELQAGAGSWEGISFALLDERGEVLTVSVRQSSRGQGEFWMGDSRNAVVDALGQRCRVGESARTLLLLDGDEELERQTVHLEPGVPGTIRIERP